MSKTLNIQSALIGFLDTMMDAHQRRPPDPLDYSPFYDDVKRFGSSMPFENANTLADIALQYSHDHLWLFAQSLNHGFEPYTSCNLVRSMLETASVGAWLVDKAVDTKTRVARVYSVRCEAIKAQIKYLDSEQSVSKSDVNQTKVALLRLAKQANAAGIHAEVKSGSVKWVGMQKPCATEMIQSILQLGPQYRLLSAVAHGHIWALHQLGFRTVKPIPKGQLLQKKEFPELVALVALYGSLALTRLIWNTAGYRECSRLQLEELIEDSMDRFQVAEHLRFWRSE